MADFLIAHKLTVKEEGLYSDDAADSGGETVLGLTRVHDEDWDGWEIVDLQKRKPNFPNNLRAFYGELDLRAQRYYRKRYWEPVKGDLINNQDIANRVYDTAVNTGIRQGIILAQRALGIEETGVMDNDTLNALN
jgi:lysozyme family protein